MDTTITFTRTEPPAWLLAMWKEIDDKTFGAGFDCFAEDAVCNLGVADWHGRENIRQNLREFIDKVRIPTQSSRRFRSTPAGNSDGSQPLIPMHSSHP